MQHGNQVAPTTSPSSFSGGCNRYLALFLCFSLTVCAQQATTLKIRPADAKQLQQSLVVGQSQAITVIVEDGAGNPIPQAAVSFRLPDQDPTGLFTNGLRSEIAITGSDGRATLAPVRWGDTAGSIPLRVTAAKGTARAGVVLQIEVGDGVATPTRPVTRTLAAIPAVEAPAKPAPKPIVLGAMIAPPKAEPTKTAQPLDLQTPKYEAPGFWKSKWFLVALAAGGAVAGGYAAAKLRTSGSGTNPYVFTPGNITQVPVVIGPPLITVGKP
ncbi:MAG: hypothetical protein ABI972_27790 [Acidobacteriota bacterium]